MAAEVAAGEVAKLIPPNRARQFTAKSLDVAAVRQMYIFTEKDRNVASMAKLSTKKRRVQSTLCKKIINFFGSDLIFRTDCQTEISFVHIIFYFTSVQTSF